MELQIGSIAKRNDRIVALGGTDHHDEPWLTTTLGVIVAMTEGNRFYTWNPVQKRKDYIRAVAVDEIESLTHPDEGLIYVQTWPNSLAGDDLLSLPESPKLPGAKDVEDFKTLVRQGRVVED